MATKHILLIEDTCLIRGLIQDRLKAEGYEVTAFGVVSEALRDIKTHKPDLLILDLGLTEEDPFSELTDGLAFLRLLLNNYEGKDIPVIVFTNNPSPKVGEQARKLGVKAVLQKVEGVKPLLDAVRLHLGSPVQNAAAA